MVSIDLHVLGNAIVANASTRSAFQSALVSALAFQLDESGIVADVGIRVHEEARLTVQSSSAASAADLALQVIDHAPAGH